MPAAERAAYANGYGHHQRGVSKLLGELSNVTPSEFFNSLRDVLIRLDAAPSCIGQLDRIRARFDEMHDKINSLEDEINSLENNLAKAERQAAGRAYE